MKKIASVILAISLVLTSAIPAFAGEADSNDLERAITKVKNIVTIPSDYEDFQYSSDQYERNGQTVSVWYLSWDKDDYSGGISATVEVDGEIIDYYKYQKEQKEGIGTVSRDAGEQMAAAFLTKVRPDLAPNMKLVENTYYSDSDSHEYQYRLYNNDIVVNYVGIDIYVDKYTGEVTEYDYQGAVEDLSDFPSKDGVIDLEAARNAYLDKIGVTLSYFSDFDYKDKELTIFPAYSVSNTDSEAIDAKTGEIVSLYGNNYEMTRCGGYGMNKIADSSTAESGLTREEMDAVENISNLISKEKAESILRNMVSGITSAMEVTSSSLSKNYVEQDKYLWEIGFEGAYGVVNAKTGELVSFYIYNYDEDNSKSGNGLTEAKAKEKAESFIKKVAADKFAQSKFYEKQGTTVFEKDDEVCEYSFNYYRQVNGIDFVGNGFTVIVDKANGMVTSYDCNWYDGIKFPSIDNAITKKAAFEAIDKDGTLGLIYTKVKEGETALVYNFTNSVGDLLIEPFNGTKLGWDGKPYKETSIQQYTDIKGHWAESTINKLLENGYYLKGEKFNPSQQITQISFLRYLYSPIQAYYDDEEFYEMLVDDKIIKENEKAPAAVLTRQDAAKFIVRYLGQGKSAEHPEIFVNPFKDTVTDSYKSYAAICYGLGIIKGDKNGRFNGTNQVTNAEAATMIFNSLQVK